MVTVASSFFGLLVGIAWPSVVLVIALAYKPEVLSFIPKVWELLSRSRKVKIPGIVEVELDAAEQQKKAGDLAKSETSTELREFQGLVRTPAIGDLERELHQKLTAFPSESHVDVLVRNLAQARLEAGFGIIYAGIFGSQIVGLNALQARRRIPNSEAYEFYLKYAQMFPEVYDQYGFSGWLGFLKNYHLVFQDNEDIVISNQGDDFLTWLKATRLATNKPW